MLKLFGKISVKKQERVEKKKRELVVGPELEIQEDPGLEKEVFKQSMLEVSEYIRNNDGKIDPETVEMITGKSLDEVFESLANEKLELSLSELKDNITSTIDDMDNRPSVLEFFRKQFKKPAAKAAFVALMLFLKFSPDLQAMDKGDEDRDKVANKTELVKENKAGDTDTYQAEGEDFEKANLSPREFIDSNVDNIKEIIKEAKYQEVINNPYLLSSLYYSQKFLKHISNEANQKNMATKIIGPIVEDLNPEFKLGVIDHFKKLSQELEQEKGVEMSELEVMPLKSIDYGHGIGHNDAIDLYIEEGSSISAMSDGLVVLAETGWSSDNEAGTSSYLGGNTIITYNYKTNEFMRYAHLEEVNVKPGEMIKAGDDLGKVGHTGMNACKPGHGGHLHLEINQVNEDGSSQFVYNKQLQERINKTRTLASH